MRRIPESGVNLFQSIYEYVRRYEARTGTSALNLSLGNPDTVPEREILELQSRFAADPCFDHHTYAESGDLRGFAEGMVELHGRIRVSEHEHLRAVPIPGIKTATAELLLACGVGGRRKKFRLVSNLPAYDVVGTWAGYVGVERVVWPLSCANNMRLDVDALDGSKADLVFVIRPGNPASVGADEAEWKALIEYCLERGARLVNDAAYSGLADGKHIPLAMAAKDYPALEWLELYSVSKSFSDPGARLGALVGSRDFVEDFLMIKGNTESGPVPYVMAAYGEFFKGRTKAKASMEARRKMYEARLAYLVPKLEKAGLRPACRTDAGFFTLWKVPKRVLGAALEGPRHQAYNRRVTDETGMVGVHFLGQGEEPLIRYAVCTDVLSPAFQERFEKVLKRLGPEY
ncbi:MAG: pyridoxal phosphate-dependent aminotransferase [Elusimicrobiota bacterium]